MIGDIDQSSAIRLDGVTARLGDTVALDDVTLHLDDARIAVIGAGTSMVPSACLTPRFAAWAWRFSAMLQGAASIQQVATPTSGWWISASEIPIA